MVKSQYHFSKTEFRDFSLLAFDYIKK